MSNFHNNTNKKDFANKLEVLRDLESEKPVEEIDVSLIKACVELILEYNDETVNFTPEEIEEKVRKIPFVEETTTLNTPPKSVKGRSTKVKSRKILLIAAIISILVAMILSTMSSDIDYNQEILEKFGSLKDIPFGEVFKINGIDVIFHGYSETYDDLETALKEENLQILYPEKLPEGIKIVELSYGDEFEKDKLLITFSDEYLFYTVTFDSEIPEQERMCANEVRIVNGIECYIVNMEDVGSTQICFSHNGNYYYLSYTDKEALIEIIENLKESK